MKELVWSELVIFQKILLTKAMNKNYIIPNEWSLIEEGFDAENVEASESLFSIGNGSMGQRANFEEDYSGKTFQRTPARLPKHLCPRCKNPF